MSTLEVAEVKNLIEKLRKCPGTDTINTMKHIAFHIKKEHKTHQANIVRNLVQILEELADSYVDPRNEGAVKVCQEIKALDKYIPYI